MKFNVNLVVKCILMIITFVLFAALKIKNKKRTNYNTQTGNQEGSNNQNKISDDTIILIILLIVFLASCTNLLSSKDEKNSKFMKIYLKQTFIGDTNYKRLESKYPKILFTKTPDSDVDIAIVSPSFVKKDNIEKMPNLKWIQLLTVGYDSADTTFLSKKNIILTNVKDVLSMTIAEDIITKILVLNRNVKKYVNQMSLGVWQTHSDEQEIFGKTIGFIGAGSLSTSAAVRLKAFGAKVICYRKSQTKHPLFDETYHDLNGLKVLLNASDYVVVTLPLNDETHHFMNMSRFKMMKKTPY